MNDNWDNYEPVGEFVESGEIVVPTPDVYDETLKQYELFREKFGDPKRIFYPCCGTDGTPIKAFPNSNLTYLDFVLNSEMFPESNVEKIEGLVTEHNPSREYDLVIIQNPGMGEDIFVPSKDLTRHLSIGGRVIANNRHGNAKEIFNDAEFENVGSFYENEGRQVFAPDFSRINETPWDDITRYLFRKTNHK